MNNIFIINRQRSLNTGHSIQLQPGFSFIRTTSLVERSKGLHTSHFIIHTYILLPLRCQSINDQGNAALSHLQFSMNTFYFHVGEIKVDEHSAIIMSPLLVLIFTPISVMNKIFSCGSSLLNTTCQTRVNKILLHK